eukprot:762716-Hanusia_phi.AAC.2
MVDGDGGGGRQRGKKSKMESEGRYDMSILTRRGRASESCVKVVEEGEDKKDSKDFISPAFWIVVRKDNILVERSIPDRMTTEVAGAMERVRNRNIKSRMARHDVKPTACSFVMEEFSTAKWCLDVLKNLLQATALTLERNTSASHNPRKTDEGVL